MPNSQRQPSLFLTHGGGPCFWIEFPPPIGAGAYDRLKAYFEGLLATLPARPRAILFVSAHWEERHVTVGAGSAPTMLYDYYGFPEHTYQLSYRAPGAPMIATRARELMQASGASVMTDVTRGFDHGVFVPMMIIDPQARIPIATLSMEKGLDPARHFQFGKALAPLRDEGVLIIGSGSTFHNMATVFSGNDDGSAAFDTWLNEAVTHPDPEVRRERLVGWHRAPGAARSHPKADHLIPLMVAAGAAAGDQGRLTFNDTIGGKRYSCFSFH